jgi:hypothetical protein
LYLTLFLNAKCSLPEYRDIAAECSLPLYDKQQLAKLFMNIKKKDKTFGVGGSQ